MQTRRRSRRPSGLDPLDRRRLAAEERVREALSCLEQAQALISRAAMDLCSVSEMEMESKVVWAYGDRLEKVCFGVDRKSGRLRVDGRLLLDYTPVYSGQAGGGQ